MPELSVHIQSSVNRTGKEYREVHEWIDNMDTKYERHDFSQVLKNAKMFTELYGEEAAQEYANFLKKQNKGKEAEYAYKRLQSWGYVK